MKRFILMAVIFTACQPGNDPIKAPVEDTPASLETATVVKAGVVRLRLNEPVSEARACIVPIAIENGLDEAARVVMIGFDLMGPGEDAKGNMFAPSAGSGEISEARVIVEGQSCAAFDTIKIPEIRCTSGEENCEDKIELVDGKALRFAQTG